MKPAAVVLFCLALLNAGAGDASGVVDPELNLDRLYREVMQIVRSHYPEATSHQLGGRIHFEFDTRVFVVHEALKTGEWQDPWEERGPKKDGILGDIEIRQGLWQGAALVPQSFEKRYFTDHLMAPYSELLDAHLYVHVKFPAQVPRSFLEQLTEVINNFEQYVDIATSTQCLKPASHLDRRLRSNRPPEPPGRHSALT